MNAENKNDIELEATKFLKSAKDYLKLGFSLIPLKWKGKAPAIGKWEPYKTSKPPESILNTREWFNGSRKNIGLILGKVSDDIIVLDFDMIDVYLKWKEAYPAIANSTTVSKTGKGYHVYLKFIGRKLPKNVIGYFSGYKLGDIKSDGGYVVAPPSVHPQGLKYEWVNPPSTGFYKIMDLEEVGVYTKNRIINNQYMAEYCNKAYNKELAKVEASIEGERNNTLFKSAAALGNLLHYRIFSKNQLQENLIIKGVNTGLSINEVKSTVVSGITQGEKKPRIIFEKSLPTSNSRENIKKEIILTPSEKIVGDEAIEAIERISNIYQRGNKLVHVITDKRPKDGINRPLNAPVILDVTQPRLRELLTEVATFMRNDSNDELIEVHQAKWLVPAILSRGDWYGLDKLEGIIEAPVLRMDGSPINTVGYDKESGLLLDTSEEFIPVSSNISDKEILQAIDVIKDIVVDFPFKSKEHQSAWFAALISPFARHTYSGGTPIFLIDANIPGAGKTLLCDICSMVMTGREMAKTSYVISDSEMRKRITSIALAGDPMVLIDNIVGIFANQSLNTALTARLWRDRGLGSNTMITAPLKTIWYGTGNNIQLNTDTIRRTLHIRLESPLENPENRKDLTHNHLLPWIKANRPPIIHAILTILKAYLDAEKPNQGLENWGSFEGWSDIVRNTLVWIGLPDPAKTRRELAEIADVESGALREIVENWHYIDNDFSGVYLKDLISNLWDEEVNNFPPKVTTDMEKEGRKILQSAISEICNLTNGRPDPNQLGRKFSYYSKRNIKDKQLIKVQKGSTRRGYQWTVINL